MYDYHRIYILSTYYVLLHYNFNLLKNYCDCYYLVKEDELYKTKYDISAHENHNNINEEIDISSKNFLN